MALPPAVWHAILVSTVCGGIYGYNSGIISGLGRSMIVCDFFPVVDPATGEPVNAVTTKQAMYQSFLTAEILFGGVAGTFLGVPVANKHGRRIGLRLTGAIAALASLLGAFQNFWFVVVARTFLGVGVGMTTVLAPLYAVEVSPPALRGRVGTVFQLAICFTIFAAYTVNYAFAPHYTTEAGATPKEFCVETWKWRAQMSAGGIWGILLLIHSFFLPETEAWLELQDEKIGNDGISYQEIGATSAHQSSKQRSASRTDSGTRASPFTLNEEGDESESPWSVLFSSKGFKWAFLAFGLAASQQLTGINAIIYYSPNILADANVGNVLVMTLLVVGLWNFLSVFVAIALVDRLGRRPLMIAALIGMTIALLIFAFAQWKVTDGSAKTAMSLTAIMLYLFSFETGPGALFFLIASEIFPSSVRDVAMVFANALAWGGNIIITLAFPNLSTALGEAATFFLLAGICVLSLVFTFTKLPETKGTEVVDHRKKSLLGRGDPDESLLTPAGVEWRK